MALWRRSAGAWLPNHIRRPFTPPTVGFHAVLVALHAKGMEALLGVEGEERVLLTADNAVLTPTSSRYHLVNPGANPRVLVVVSTRYDADTGRREPERCVVAGGRDAATARRGARCNGPRRPIAP